MNCELISATDSYPVEAIFYESPSDKWQLLNTNEQNTKLPLNKVNWDYIITPCLKNFHVLFFSVKN